MEVTNGYRKGACNPTTKRESRCCCRLVHATSKEVSCLLTLYKLFEDSFEPSEIATDDRVVACTRREANLQGIVTFQIVQRAIDTRHASSLWFASFAGKCLEERQGRVLFLWQKRVARVGFEHCSHTKAETRKKFINHCPEFWLLEADEVACARAGMVCWSQHPHDPEPLTRKVSN